MGKCSFKSLQESYLPMFFCPKQDTWPIRMNKMVKGLHLFHEAYKSHGKRMVMGMTEKSWPLTVINQSNIQSLLGTRFCAQDDNQSKRWQWFHWMRSSLKWITHKYPTASTHMSPMKLHALSSSFLRQCSDFSQKSDVNGCTLEWKREKERVRCKCKKK